MENLFKREEHCKREIERYQDSHGKLNVFKSLMNITIGFPSFDIRNDNTEMINYWRENLDKTMNEIIEVKKLRDEENKRIEEYLVDKIVDIETLREKRERTKEDLDNNRKKLRELKENQYKDILIKTSNKEENKEKFSIIITLIVELNTKFSPVISTINKLKTTILSLNEDNIQSKHYLLTLNCLRKSPIIYEALTTGQTTKINSITFIRNHNEIFKIEDTILSKLTEERKIEYISELPDSSLEQQVNEYQEWY